MRADLIGRPEARRLLRQRQDLHFASFIGDSMTAVAGGETGHYGTSWAGLFAFLSRDAIRPVANYAVTGAFSADVVANQLAAAVADASDTIFVLIGTNDAKGGTAAATTQANIATITAAIAAAGKVPVVCTIPPLSWQSNVTWKANAVALNAWLRSHAASNGHPLVDFYDALVNASGDFESIYTTDALHPNATGHRVMADKASFDVGYRFSPHVLRSEATAVNLIANAGWVLDGDADGLANNLTESDAGGVMTPSREVIDGLIGYAQVMTWSGAGTASLSQTIASGFAVGDRLRYAGRLWTSGCVAGGLRFVTFVRFNGSGQPDFYPLWVTALSFDVTDGRFTADKVVPAGTTSVQVVWQGTNGTGDAKIGRPSLRNLGA